MAAKTNAFQVAVAVHMGVKDVQGHAMMAAVQLVQADVVVIAKAIVKEIVWATVKATAKVAAKILVLVVQSKITIQINHKLMKT